MKPSEKAAQRRQAAAGVDGQGGNTTPVGQGATGAAASRVHAAIPSTPKPRTHSRKSVDLTLDADDRLTVLAFRLDMDKGKILAQLFDAVPDDMLFKLLDREPIRDVST